MAYDVALSPLMPNELGEITYEDRRRDRPGIVHLAMEADILWPERDPEFLSMLGDVYEDVRPPFRVKSWPLPEWVSFWWWCDEGCRPTTTDDLDQPLRYTTAEELVRIPSEMVNKHPWSRAIWVLLRALPLKTPIVLYWT